MIDFGAISLASFGIALKLTMPEGSPRADWRFPGLFFFILNGGFLIKEFIFGFLVFLVAGQNRRFDILEDFLYSEAELVDISFQPAAGFEAAIDDFGAPFDFQHFPVFVYDFLELSFGLEELLFFDELIF